MTEEGVWAQGRHSDKVTHTTQFQQSPPPATEKGSGKATSRDGNEQPTKSEERLLLEHNWSVWTQLTKYSIQRPLCTYAKRDLVVPMLHASRTRTTTHLLPSPQRLVLRTAAGEGFGSTDDPQTCARQTPIRPIPPRPPQGASHGGPAFMREGEAKPQWQGCASAPAAKSLRTTASRWLDFLPWTKSRPAIDSLNCRLTIQSLFRGVCAGFVVIELDFLLAHSLGHTMMLS